MQASHPSTKLEFLGHVNTSMVCWGHQVLVQVCLLKHLLRKVLLNPCIRNATEAEPRSYHYKQIKGLGNSLLKHAYFWQMRNSLWHTPKLSFHCWLSQRMKPVVLWEKVTVKKKKNLGSLMALRWQRFVLWISLPHRFSNIFPQAKFIQYYVLQWG